MSSRSPARFALNRFLDSVEFHGRVLDLGCGSSRYTRHHPRTIRVDLAPQEHVHVLGDALHVPFREESFDTVICTELLEHLTRPRQAVEEIHRVLRSGGRCILSTRFCYPIHGAPHDYFRFSEFSLRSLFASWRIQRLEPDIDSFSTLIQALHLLSSERGGSWTRRMARPLLMLSWKTYFRLYPLLRIEPGSPLLPSGYHLIAQKR